MRITCLLIALLVCAPALRAGSEMQLDWSGRFDLRLIDTGAAPDAAGRTDFFSRYEFTSDRNGSPALELGIGAFDLDLMQGEVETPKLQLRFLSPTSNLGLTNGGSGSSESFLNQRAWLSARPRGVALDLDYRRFRTDAMRLFGLDSFVPDQTAADDAFFTRRNRIGADLHLRPLELASGRRGALGGVLSEVILRAGYRSRAGQKQIRTEPDEISLGQFAKPIDQQVADAGTGLVLRLLDMATLTLDFDYQGFRSHAPMLTPVPIPPLVPVRFVPDTDRLTGTLRMATHFSDRVRMRGAFRVTSLEQTGERAPQQRANGLHDNALLLYSASLGADVRLSRRAGLNAFFKLDSRQNRIDRSTALFDRDSEGAAFLKELREIEAGSEFVLTLPLRSRVGLGVRGEWVDRDLEESNLPIVAPDEAIRAERRRAYSLQARIGSRPLKGLRLRAVLGYRNASVIGHMRELQEGGYGHARASYAFPFSRPLSLSVFGRWEFGDHNSFSTPSKERPFGRERSAYGATLTGSPIENWTFFGSVFRNDDSQDFDLRVKLRGDQPRDYRAGTTTLVIGGHATLAETFDIEGSYSYTRSDWRMEPGDGSGSDAIEALSHIDSDLHRLQSEIGYRVRPGLRVSAAYRYDDYADHAYDNPTPDSFDPSAQRHTLLFSLTLDSSFGS